MAEAVAHPTPQQLSAFGLGKLPPAAADAVARHLAGCPACRQAVAALPPDSFLDKVRAARPTPSGTRLPPPLAPLWPPPEPPPAELPPELADHPKFRIVRELGKGGMGVIYLAEHRVMNKLVALKVISRAVLNHPNALARFHAEVQAAGKLDHPNIARAHDADQAADLHFLVLEYVEGLTLAQLVGQQGPLPVADACRYAHQAALGLQHAFEQGTVHRDVKPQNLMLTPQGQVKVLDFGLVRLWGERGVGRLTQVGALMGTPEYMAPEQATDPRKADTRADVYSLGCTLYFLLAGRSPFGEGSAAELVVAHLRQEPAPLQRLCPAVPAELSAVVARMLAKDPAQRFQSPIEAARALAPFVKAAAKPGAKGLSAPALGVGSAAKGTRIDSDTGHINQVVQEVSPKAPPADVPANEAAALPFTDRTSTATAPKQVGHGRDSVKASLPAWWKRPGVLAAVVGVSPALILMAVLILKVRTAESIVVLEGLPAGAEVTPVRPPLPPKPGGRTKGPAQSPALPTTSASPKTDPAPAKEAAASAPSVAVEALTPAQAAQKAGQKVTVQFRVRAHGYNPEGFKELYSEPAWNRPGTFFIRFPQLTCKWFGDLGVPDVWRHFQGKLIRATGTVTILRFDGVSYASIRIDDPRQIQIIDPGEPRTEGPGVKSDVKPATPAPGRAPKDDPAKAAQAQRKKRGDRWKLLFRTNNGAEHLNQLRGLGAILAIPVTEGPPPTYRVVRDLARRPARLLAEDVSTIQRIDWVDNTPQSVADLMDALGLSIRPSHFKAFMPEEVEKQLYELEKAEAHGRPEDDIKETRFRVKRVGNRYEPELEKIIFK
jgi:serine/threonine protein kinase